MHLLSKIKYCYSLTSLFRCITKNFIISSMSSPMHSCISLCAHAYRIVRADNTSRIQTRSGGSTGGPPTRSARRRRTGPGGVTRVPRP
jgi:hypothetical protein